MATNGALPSSSLTELSTPGRLTTEAARAYEDLRRALGTTGTTYSNHAYRSVATQEDLFTQNYQPNWCEYAPGKVDKRIWNGDDWYRKPGHAATAVPGTSNHGWGKAVDWQGLGGYGSSAWERFADLAPAYGWDHTEGRANGEPWHWVYVGGYTGGWDMTQAEFEKIEKALYQTSNGGVGDNVAMFGTPGGVLSSLRFIVDELNRQKETHGAILDAIADIAVGSTTITEADIQAISESVTALLLSNIKLSGSLVLEQAASAPQWTLRH